MKPKIFLSSTRILFSLLFGFAASSRAEEIYKWTDESGRIHYSQQDPKNKKATTLTTDESANVMDPPTPAMEKRVQEIQTREKKEQAARAREEKKMQMEQEKKDKDAALVAECKRNFRSYCDSADLIRKVENQQMGKGAGKKHGVSGQR